MKLLTAGDTVQASNHLGGGCYGVCFAIDDDTVVKFTSSRKEFETAMKLVGKPLESCWRIYAAGQCDSDTKHQVERFAHRFYHCERVYWIVGERVEPLDQARIASYDKGWQLWQRMAIKLSKRVNNELMRYGAIHSDIHSNNVGFRGARMVAFDIQ